MEETESQKLYNIAKEKGLMGKKEYIKFKGTDKHILKFIKDELIDGTNFRTKQPEKKVRYTFEEDHIEKFYETATYRKNAEGEETEEPSNFVQGMSTINYGESLSAEYTPIEGTFKGFIKIDKLSDTPKKKVEEIIDDSIPTIDENNYTNNL